MFFWFIGAGWLLVAAVFQSPALDYRLVMLGALLPLLDVLTGGPWMLHTLLASVFALAAVMVLTAPRRLDHRRLVRRRWLGIPIGMFVHLVLDGAWTNTGVFWWPAFGTSFGHARLPELDRGALSLLMELAGLAASAYGVNRYGLRDAEARKRFLRTGQLPR
ncbi:MAG TPA: hypothetical protein VGZ52_12390 [Acidimicrobiales bacterium]|nr:hypothetical protein [Acidimicrobiales bacterium]